MSALGAKMVELFQHEPVLLQPVVDFVGKRAGRSNEVISVLDCTLGGGGHAEAILKAYPNVRLLGMDRDPEALEASAERLSIYADRFGIIHGSFSQVRSHLSEHDLSRVDVVLADLGVSSHQIDSPNRGFSFRYDGPLDMRMDPTSGQSLEELLADVGVDELAQILWSLGEERYSRPVARGILMALPTSTLELAGIVRKIVPPSKDRIDTATRTFQALRIAVNDELGELHALLDILPSILDEDGLALMISFHSLEDRAVKRAFKSYAKGCICPPALPLCGCGRKPTFEILTKRPHVESASGISSNPRSRSAKLRVAKKLRLNDVS
jgi:16S rRNA (cytosine1402-N4)-methyltransferase